MPVNLDKTWKVIAVTLEVPFRAATKV